MQLAEPVNRFLDYVRYIVQQLKTLCPAMGKKKLAENSNRCWSVVSLGFLRLAATMAILLVGTLRVW